MGAIFPIRSQPHYEQSEPAVSNAPINEVPSEQLEQPTRDTSQPAISSTLIHEVPSEQLEQPTRNTSEPAVSSTPIDKASIQQWKMQVRGVLTALEETMDSLVAASMYNSYYSPIYHLPPEIFLLIIRQLYHDEPTFFCLRQVSRLFQKLINSKEFQGHIFPTYYPPGNAKPGSGWCEEMDKFRRTIKRTLRLGFSGTYSTELEEICTRLRRDALCLTCQENRRLGPRCRFNLSHNPFSLKDTFLHCSGCQDNHPKLMFSTMHQNDGSQGTRICIGREGHIRLCEHEAITWADVESHLIEWRANPRPYSDIIVKFCADPVHNFGCKPSPPLARLTVYNSWSAGLELSWEPHTGPHPFTSFPGNPIKASEVRTLARKYRLNAARFIIPEQAAGHLPEMECFPFGECDCLCYHGPNDWNYADSFHWEHDCPTPTTDRRLLPQQHRRLCACGAWCVPHRRVTTSFTTLRSLIRIDQSCDWGSSFCVRIQYQKIVYICGNGDKKYAPGMRWCNALDPDSFKGGGDCYRLPRCKDISCANHYVVDYES